MDYFLASVIVFAVVVVVFAAKTIVDNRTRKKRS